MPKNVIQIANAVNRGEVVSEDIIFGLLSKRLEDGYYRGEIGFILDGLPRSRIQAVSPLLNFGWLLKINARTSVIENVVLLSNLKITDSQTHTFSHNLDDYAARTARCLCEVSSFFSYLVSTIGDS